MNRRAYLRSSAVIGGSLLLPAGVVSLVGCGSSTTNNSSDLISGFNGKIMGTSYSVRMVGNAAHSKTESTTAARALSLRVHAALVRVDSTMSTWRADSEVALFNRSLDTDWQTLTPATIQVLAHAQATSMESRGAFDPTIGPMIDLWGFGAGAVKTNGKVSLKKPPARAISESLARVGYESIDIDLNRHAIRKRLTNVELDLSGIAKGFAVDVIARLLSDAGVNSFLVEVGGELRARGRKPGGAAWKVAIERPGDVRPEAYRVLQLNDNAIATSGDYRNFFIDGGQRYSHSIDPRTGQAVNHDMASITVVAESTMQADALSTAMMVLGPEAASDYASQHDIAAHFILKSGRALKEVYSRAFERLLV